MNATNLNSSVPTLQQPICVCGWEGKERAPLLQDNSKRYQRGKRKTLFIPSRKIIDLQPAHNRSQSSRQQHSRAWSEPEPNQPVKQKLYGDTRENKSSTFRSFIINLPLYCAEMLGYGALCVSAWGPPRRQCKSPQAPGAALASRQPQLVPASSDTSSPGPWLYHSLFYVC